MSSTSPFVAVARKELGDALRNRWIWMVSGLLASVSLAVAYFGAAPAGVTGVQQNGALMASLMNLAVYLVPLVALVLGCGAVIDEKQRGTLDLILVYPVSRAQYFAGTFAGFALALSAAITTGFGAAGAVLVWRFDLPWTDLALLGGLALLLGVVFLAVSFLVSILARDRGRAVVSSVFVWLASVLLFDLVLVGALVATGGDLPEGAFTGLLLANPTDLFRMLCFRWIEGVAAPLGLGTLEVAAPPALWLVAALTAWLAAPALAAYAVFRRRVAADALV